MQKIKTANKTPKNAKTIDGGGGEKEASSRMVQTPIFRKIKNSIFEKEKISKRKKI